jgi:hypothetical protein
MIEGSCHCGAVRFRISERPEKLVDCNCTICRRLGALWGHVEVSSVEIDAEDDATISYVQGDENLAMHSCKRCGCTTHWENLKPDEFSHMAVNFRMCDPSVVEEFQIRRFDGAETWEFLD